MADGVELATGYVSLVISGDKIGPGVKRALGDAEPEVDRAGKRSGKRFSSAFGSGLKLVGGAAIGAGLVKGFNSTVSAASDLNETINKSSIIFGKNAAAIEQWADDADRNLGLSKQAALEAAAGFGDMFSQIGFGGTEAAKLSKSVVQMSADLGSFNNLGTDEVADRISAAFRGEYDSLQALIPNINAARVESEALAKTGKKTAKELTAAEKASAVLAIVQKDGARAAGDFARTSDGLANSQKIQAAEVENLKAQIGSGLLPIQLKATRFIADKAVPAISDFVSGMQDGTGAGGDFADILEDVGDALKTTFEVGKDLVGVFNDLPGPVKKFAVQGLLAYAALRQIQSVTGPVVSGLTTMNAGLKSGETSLKATAKASIAAGGALRNAAGAGGMLALYQSTQVADKGMSTFLSTVGGAAAGFAVGGPIGAAVGGLGGLMFGLFKRTKQANDEFSITGPATSYAESLDQISGAATKATRALVATALAKDEGLSESLTAIGVSSRDMVSAILGQPAALKKVQSAIQGAQGRTVTLVNAMGQLQEYQIGNKGAALDVAAALGVQSRALETDIAKTKGLAIATEDLKVIYGGLPKKAITEIGQKGGALTRDQIIDLTAKYDNIDKRDVKTLLSVNNLPNTLADIRAVQRAADEAARNRTLTVFVKATFNDSKFDKLDGKALGGPVRKGQPYIVGERRPELFVPNQSGRILPRVPSTTGTATSATPGRMVVQIGDREFVGYVRELADASVDSASYLNGQRERAL